ncbi:hypothetical protein ACHQM5_010013 [Ranunculus cassubicifolius]
MVLSNKKLKQKLRATLAAGGGGPSLIIKDLLVSATPRLSKREKRRKISSLNPPSTNNKEETIDDLKKRKRKEIDTPKTHENGVSQPKEEKKKKKLKKKKNKVKKTHVKVKAAEPEQPQPVEAIQSEENENDDASTKVYVGGIPYYSTEDDIQAFFQGCGTITQMDCITFPDTGKFKGIAMITFKTEAAAKRALALDGADMGGLFLKIQPYKASRVPISKSADFAPKIIEGYNRVYVGNLSWDITEDDLRKFFSDCKVSSIRFGEDKLTGEFRGFAHVDFTDSLSLTIALQLDQKEVCGRPAAIRCAVAPKKKPDNIIKSGSGNKKVEAKAEVEIKKAEVETEGETVSSGGGKKRRTCYECGVPGHISSECPKEIKKAEVEIKKTEVATVSSGGGKKRRTCYECGVPGHISSECPKRQAVDPPVIST